MRAILPWGAVWLKKMRNKGVARGEDDKRRKGQAERISVFVPQRYRIRKCLCCEKALIAPLGPVSLQSLSPALPITFDSPVLIHKLLGDILWHVLYERSDQMI